MSNFAPQSPWQIRCQAMLGQEPTESQQKFISSVLAQIQRSPMLYPTPAQEVILKRIEGHLERKQLKALLGDSADSLPLR